MNPKTKVPNNNNNNNNNDMRIPPHLPSNVASIPSQPSVIKRKPQHALCPISPTATNDSNGGPRGEVERSQAIIGLERNSTTCQTVARHGGSRHPNSAGAGRNANLQAFVENTTGQSTSQGGGGGGHSVGKVEEPVGKYPMALVRPPVYMEEELHTADPKLQEFVAADWKLINFFGDTIHQNDGTHLHVRVSVAMGTSWQRWWEKVLVGPHNLYHLSCGNDAHQFLALLT